MKKVLFLLLFLFAVSLLFLAAAPGSGPLEPAETVSFFPGEFLIPEGGAGIAVPDSSPCPFPGYLMLTETAGSVVVNPLLLNCPLSGFSLGVTAVSYHLRL